LVAGAIIAQYAGRQHRRKLLPTDRREFGGKRTVTQDERLKSFLFRKTATYSIACFFVLPHGSLTLATGHLLGDYLVLLFFVLGSRYCSSDGDS